jgi:hypothetical protein
MAKAERCLIAGGVMSGLVAILHAVLAVEPALYRYVAPGQGSTLAEMAVEGSSVTTIASVAIALVFALWALYAFSGAGLIGRLPLLRAALIAIGAIYVLRALALPTEIRMVSAEGYPFRFVVFSGISLVAGLLYLIGAFRQRAPQSLGR